MIHDNRIFMGMDIETTGSDIDKGAGLIQIGFGGRTPQGGTWMYSRDVHPGLASIDPEAMAVNGISEDRMKNAPFASEVDVEVHRFLSEILEESGIAPGKKGPIIPIGWNVAGFDVPFVRKFLPRTASLLSYRSVDLNAVIYTIGPKSYLDIKRAAKRHAEESILGESQWHDAGYDALAGYLAWEYLKSITDMHAKF